MDNWALEALGNRERMDSQEERGATKRIYKRPLVHLEELGNWGQR